MLKVAVYCLQHRYKQTNKQIEMKEFRKGQTYFATRRDGSMEKLVWSGDTMDRFRVRQGIAFHTEAEAKAEELKRPDKRYPKKMLVWDSDLTNKIERTVLGTLAGKYMTAEDFGAALEAARDISSTTVIFYRHAEDIPETLEDYLNELVLDQATTDKIIELAKKMK